MSIEHRPRVFPLRPEEARLNNPTSRSVRVVNPESTGQGRLYAGAFWSDPGSEAGWSFVPGDPNAGTMTDGIPHLGDHDEVYLCVSGRCRMTWEAGGSAGGAGITRGEFEFGAMDVIHFPAGFTYWSKSLGPDPLICFWVMSPTPDWMMPLRDPASE